MKMLSSTLVFLVLASGFALADKPCYDTHGKIVQCPTVKPAAKPAPTPAPVGEPTTIQGSRSNSSDRVSQPATPTTPPAGLAIDNGRNNPDSRIKQPAPTTPAPVGIAISDPGGERPGPMVCHGNQGQVIPCGTKTDRVKEPTPAPAPSGATTVINGSKSNNFRVKEPTPAPAPAGATTVKSSKSNSSDRVKEPAPTPAGSKDKTAPYRDPEDMTTH